MSKDVTNIRILLQFKYIRYSVICCSQTHDMGLLFLGTPLSWEDAKSYADHVREHGITQFLHTWDRVKDRRGDELLWGDEVPLLASRSSCPPSPILR